MSDARIIGWSDDGWPILHPDDIDAMGDAVNDSLDPRWEGFAERVLGREESRQRSRATWLAAMKPAVQDLSGADAGRHFRASALTACLP